MRRKVVTATGARLALTLVLGAGAIAGCATPPAGTEVEPPSLSASSATGAAALSATYGACVPGVMYDQGPPSLGWLAKLTPWRRVGELVSAGPDEHGRQLVEIVDDAGTARTESLVTGKLAGLQWGLENDAEVWLGVAPKSGVPEEIDGVVVFTAGDAFFPGECMDDQYAYAHSRLGDETAAVLAHLRSEPDLDARMNLLRVGSENDHEPQPEASVPVILSPGIAPAGLLKSLRHIQLHITVTAPVDVDGGSTTICSHIDEGWGGDCAMADDATGGVRLGGYVGESGIVELWLMDGQADFTEPIGYLGAITAGAGRNLSTTVTIDTAHLDPSTLPATADGTDPGIVHATPTH